MVNLNKKMRFNRTLTEFNVDGKVKNIVKHAYGYSSRDWSYETWNTMLVGLSRREANLKDECGAETIRIERGNSW